MSKKISIITLFPEMFAGVFSASMLRKAQEINKVSFNLVNLRDFGIGPRQTVDDTPYGGGDGMLLRPEPLFAAVEHAKINNSDSKVLLMTPRGEQLKQEQLVAFSSQAQNLIIICGRYEGYDERITSIVDKEVSIGDYVLTGGELPAMVLIDGLVRLIPGVLGGEESALKESFSDGVTKEHPHYTRPEEFRGMKVPEVLLSGNHAAIKKWRVDNSCK